MTDLSHLLASDDAETREFKIKTQFQNFLTLQFDIAFTFKIDIR